MRSKEVDKSIKSLEKFVNQKYYNGVTAEEMKIVLTYISKLEGKCAMQEYRINEMDIPKQVIRDKVEKLRKKYNNLFDSQKVLKELLGE